MAININIESKASNLVPLGDYVVIFSSFEHKIFNSGSEAIELTFDIAEGEYAGKKLKMNLWPYGTTGGANFAQVRIAQIAKYSGLKGDIEGEDYDDCINKLLNRTMGVAVVEMPDEGYGPKNEIKSFKDVSKVVKPSAKPVAPVVAKPVAQKADGFVDDMPF